MNFSNIAVAFNYQNEISIADSIFNNDEDAGKKYFKKVSAKYKSLKKMNELLNRIRFDILEVSLVEAAFAHPQGKMLVETLFFAFINALNTVQHTDQRNQASYTYFDKLRKDIENFNAPVIDIQDYKTIGFKDQDEIEKIVYLTDIFTSIGSASEASPVFASAFMRMHPTHQQALVRAYRNAMLEITARHHIHGQSVDPDLLKIATYAASCGVNIGFPYI